MSLLTRCTGMFFILSVFFLKLRSASSPRLSQYGFTFSKASQPAVAFLDWCDCHKLWWDVVFWLTVVACQVLQQQQRWQRANFIVEKTSYGMCSSESTVLADADGGSSCKGSSDDDPAPASKAPPLPGQPPHIWINHGSHVSLSYCPLELLLRVMWSRSRAVRQSHSGRQNCSRLSCLESPLGDWAF